uniref:Putative rho gtpase-activating protein 7 isoform x2 n=1 Tax=Ornithodoros turicata TaxID=34597 RepID=A0A2R5LMZ0_9ACAR
MMPSNMHDPYRELEAYLQQAQDAVGKAVEDLLASESSDQLFAGCRKKSYDEDATEDAFQGVPRKRRSHSSDGSCISPSCMNGSKTHQVEEWDPYYGWSSLNFSRPPSGDANLLAVYTDRLVQAVNGTFAEDIPESAGDHHHATRVNGLQNDEPQVETVTVSHRGQEVKTVPEKCLQLPVEELVFWPSVCEHDQVAAFASLSHKSPSWPTFTTAKCVSGEPVLCRSNSYPGCLGSCAVDVERYDSQVNFDGSLYKNQQLYYDPDERPEKCMEEGKGLFSSDVQQYNLEEVGVPPLERIHIQELDTVGGIMPEIELRIQEPGDVEELPELFIKENDADQVPLRKRLILDLSSTCGEDRLNSFRTQLVAGSELAPGAVEFQPLVSDQLDSPGVFDGTATWSSTSTTHSGSVVSRQDLEEFLKSVEPPHEPPPPQDAVTQTTPQLSPSSSFTWLTDCGQDLSSSKESLRTPTRTTSPALSSSSCDAPLTPLTPRASPSSQASDSVHSEGSVNAIGTPVATASPSLPTLVNGCNGTSNCYSTAGKDSDTRSLPRPVSKTAPMSRRQPLNQKACSAPMLLKPPNTLSVSAKHAVIVPGLITSSASNTPEEEVKVFLQERSQSAKDVKEVEAVHACEWLRQAGFPQYVQMYEDNTFPVEITSVLKDHPNLDQDELQSLFRRLNTLNKCARMKRDGLVKQSIHQDSDEDEGLALSNNWQFHRGSRRWSRVSPPVVVTPSGTQEAYSSHDSVFLDEPRSSPDSRLSTSDERIIGVGPDEGSPGPKLRRSGSERIRDAILKRMDSFRGTRRRKERPQDGLGDPNSKGIARTNHLGPEGHALSDSECSPQLDPRKKLRGYKHKECWLMTTDRNSFYDNVPTTQVQVLGNDNRVRDNSSMGSGSLGGGEQERVQYIPERRDSGVGSSLTRPAIGSPSSFPWHCFTTPSEQLPCLAGQRYDQLSASQLLVFRKLAMLRLTALMERFSPPYRSGWGWAVPKFIKRMRAPDYKDKAVFGVPLSVSLQRTGHALPLSIQGAMDFLQKSASDSTGLFRKSGVRSRIQKLRSLHEMSSTAIVYEPHQAYDVADLLKQYFRELPEGLLTSKLSDTFLCIFQHIPEEYRLDALQAAILLIPDENREVLESLLIFLDDICRHAQENQMTAANVAVCFAPSLFQLAVPRSASTSPRRRATTVGIPDQRELSENRAAHECLTYMIAEHRKLFQIPAETIQQCHLELFEPTTIEELGGLKSFLDGSLHVLIVEAKEKSKGWTIQQHPEVELAFKKPGDGIPLRLWRCAVEVEAPPVELLTRILRERHIWDSALLKWRLVARLDKQTEVVQYVCSSMKPQPPREFCILRSWRTELVKGACALIELSVKHPAVPQRGIRGIVLSSRYLIEPCGAGKSRITHISRIDFRGRTPEWYNKVYGHLSALLLTKLRDSFAQRTEGPETKV